MFYFKQFLLTKSMPISTTKTDILNSAWEFLNIV